MRIILFLLMITIFQTQSLFCDTQSEATKSMHNSFGKGFEASKKNDTKNAISNFKEAGSFAQEAQNWNGIIDAGNALRNLGQDLEAHQLFLSALPVAEKNNDWHQLIGTGYALAGLPQATKSKSSIHSAFEKAAQISIGNNDWIGLSEAANGMIHIEENEKAILLLDQGLELVRSLYSADGCQTLMNLYQQLDRNDRVEVCQQVLDEIAEITGGFQGRAKVQPPEGWSPVGESVAGAPILDIEVQKANRASADEQIRQKHEYIMQQEKIEAEQRNYANYWSGYYYYPYGCSYGSYTAWSSDLIVSWGNSCSSYYTYSDGYYSYSGSSYSGFGFSYGYADSDVGVYFGVYT